MGQSFVSTIQLFKHQHFICFRFKASDTKVSFSISKVFIILQPCVSSVTTKPPMLLVSEYRQKKKKNINYASLIQ